MRSKRGPPRWSSLRSTGSSHEDAVPESQRGREPSLIGNFVSARSGWGRYHPRPQGRRALSGAAGLIDASGAGRAAPPARLTAAGFHPIAALVDGCVADDRLHIGRSDLVKATDGARGTVLRAFAGADPRHVRKAAHRFGCAVLDPFLDVLAARGCSAGRDDTDLLAGAAFLFSARDDAGHRAGECFR